MVKKTGENPTKSAQLKSTSSKNPSKAVKSSTSHPKKSAKAAKPAHKPIKKSKVYKKTPLKSSFSKPDSLIISSKREPKKTEKAIESAEQANLFKMLKTPYFSKPKAPKKSRNKKVSFNLSHVEVIKGKSQETPRKPAKIAKVARKPLQSIMKPSVSSALEDRVGALERQIQEIFAILTKNSKKH